METAWPVIEPKVAYRIQARLSGIVLLTVWEVRAKIEEEVR